MANVYKKGTTYHNYTELGPVLDSVTLNNGELSRWYRDNRDCLGYGLPNAGEFPITLTRDIPIPQPELEEPPKPLTAEQCIDGSTEGEGIWCWFDGQPIHISLWRVMVRHMYRGSKFYATEDDCKRAHELEGE